METECRPTALDAPVPGILVTPVNFSSACEVQHAGNAANPTTQGSTSQCQRHLAGLDVLGLKVVQMQVPGAGFSKPVQQLRLIRQGRRAGLLNSKSPLSVEQG